jgi:hypothetical protein
MHSISNIRVILFGLMVGLILIFCAQSFAQVGIGISVNFAPPDLPVYDQPLCPGPDYIWTPGYWAWDEDDGYYWVPGTWVLAPEPDYYWTPAYWAWEGGGYRFFPGYWGPVIGFYGGINYGHGYFGHGYEGGRWERGHFYYNRSVTNINVTEIHNVYNTTVVNNTVNRVSYNGGNGGISARPTAQEEAATRERHIPAVGAQTQHMQAARSNPEMRASANRGRPPIAATARPGVFREGAVAAKEGGTIHGPVGGRQEGRGTTSPQQTHAPATPERNARVPEPPSSGRTTGQQPSRNESARPTYTHPNEIPRPERPAPSNTGNAKMDQKYQQQQQKLDSQQARDRQKLQQRQDQEHQRVAQQQANEAQKQQMEQRHQQQTQQMMQRHEQQSQNLQNRQQPHAQQAPPGHAESHPPEQHK